MTAHEVGAPLPPFVDQPLTRSDFVRYQGASGDMNPIHHDDDVARAAGFPSVFAVGMRQAGVLASCVTAAFGATSVVRFGVRFRELAWPGDVITYSGRVSAVRDDLVDLELEAALPSGLAHLVGTATVCARCPAGGSVPAASPAGGGVAAFHEPFTFPIELGKVREFARATRATAAEYLEGDHPPIPPTFLMAAAWWQSAEQSMTRPDRDLSRLLHGAQEFIYHAAVPRSGDVLTGRSRLDRTYQKAGRRGGTMTFHEYLTEFSGPDGEPVASSRATAITTERAPSEA